MSDIRLVQKTSVSDVEFPLWVILDGFNIRRQYGMSLQSSYSYLTSMVHANTRCWLAHGTYPHDIVSKMIVNLEICNLPRDVGPCRGLAFSYYHNSKTNTCEPFDYGGCGGNNNRFSMKEECTDFCSYGKFHPLTVDKSISSDNIQLPQLPSNWLWS